jgi:hypothetical protein
MVPPWPLPKVYPGPGIGPKGKMTDLACRLRVLAGSTPASIRRLSHSVTQFSAKLLRRFGSLPAKASYSEKVSRNVALARERASIATQKYGPRVAGLNRGDCAERLLATGADRMLAIGYSFRHAVPPDEYGKYVLFRRAVELFLRFKKPTCRAPRQAPADMRRTHQEAQWSAFAPQAISGRPPGK